MDQTALNLQQQTELYGEPLGELVRRVLAPLGLTQGALAQVIGLSAPMLSQLMSAQRVKIGNPAVLSRLHALDELAHLAVIGEVDPNDLPDEIDRIRGVTGAFTRSTPTTQLPGHAASSPGPGAGGATPFASPPTLTPSGAPTQSRQAAGVPGVSAGTAASAGPPSSAGPPPSARAVVREIQDLFRAVASAEEIQRAATAIAPDSPALAELLLTYGAGRTADALAHYEHHHG
jgi:transcriptional regulator with XRE-family HTH domain